MPPLLIDGVGVVIAWEGGGYSAIRCDSGGAADAVQIALLCFRGGLGSPCKQGTVSGHFEKEKEDRKPAAELMQRFGFLSLIQEHD